MGAIEAYTAPAVPEHLVELGASFAQRYQPVLDFDGWRVAMLRYFDATAPETFHRVERHWNTNEVFILTTGKAFLILFDGDAAPVEPYYVLPMVHNVAYNVLRSVWHHAVMSPDAHILLVERSETGMETTDYAELAPATIEAIQRQFAFATR